MLMALPEMRIHLVDPRLKGAYAMIALAGMLAIAFLPRALVNADEYYYAGQARTLLHGRVLPIDGDPLPVPLVAPERAARYPPGWPLALTLGRAVSFRSMFVITLLAHLIGGIAVARMLIRRGAPGWLNAAYLFHPVFWAFSGTLMSDVPTAVAFLVAMDAWEQGRVGTSGATLAIAGFSRIASAIAALGFLIAIAGRDRRRGRRLVAVAACAAAGVCALMLWNRLVYGTLLVTEYAGRNWGLLNGRMALENVLLYGVGLLALPPFSAACLIVRPRQADRWALIAIPVLAFFALYAYHDASANVVMTVVGGQRLVLAAHAALLVATARTWSDLAAFRRKWLVAVAGVGIAVAASLVLRRLEAPHRRAAEMAARCAPSSLAYNMNAVRAAAAVDAHSFHLLDGRDHMPEADLAILSRRTLSRRPGANPMLYSGPEPTSAPCSAVGEYQIYDLAGTCRLEGEPCEAMPGSPATQTPSER